MMIGSTFACALMALGSLPIANSQVTPRATNASCSAANIPSPILFGVAITSLTATVLTNYTGLGVDVCQVNVTLTHPGANDSVLNQILLPMTAWNGRFQGIGGGGFSAGSFSALAPIAAQGYACVSTDAGHVLNSTDASSWGLISPGNVNQYLLLNFGYRSYHEMTVVAKAVIQSFYGTPASYSYWNGCSTGGRQGLSQAQRYPQDYDGILANAPASDWNNLSPATLWPFVVMNNEGYAPLPCEFDAVNAAVYAACDGLDGLMDGLISAPALCNFDANSLVGQTYLCASNNRTRTFTQKTAVVLNKIWQGPTTPQGQMKWFGIPKGANFSTLAGTYVSSNGTAIPIPFSITNSGYHNFVYKDLNYNLFNITYDDFFRTYRQQLQDYDSVIGTNDPDLSAFKARGGKMITWHGLADPLIMPQGNMYYYRRVAALDPFVADFYRQFYSPGVGHCSGGPGVVPTNAINQLRAWVENGTAPATLSAASLYPINATTAFATNGSIARRQNLCPYPYVNKYVSGDPNQASSYTCAGNTGWESFPTPGYVPFY